MEGRWITGEEVLIRWQAAPFELVDAMRSKKLHSVNWETGVKGFDVDREECLYCDKWPVNGYTVCSDGSEREPSPGTSIPPVAPGSSAPEALIVRCRFDADHERGAWRARVARASIFAFAEVEAYEQARGLGPLPHAPESAEALAETLRAAGITDAGMVARMVKAAFPETTLPKIGVLVTGKPDDKGNRAANIKAAQRALNPK
jgi:hypothetical protein